MENTEILNLPYIMPSQAQKHVTHNEALRQLDALIQLSVISMQVSDPPISPEAGERYIVRENATGVWAGLEGQVLAYLDGAWTAFAPRQGWLAYVEDQSTFVVRTDTDWEALFTPATLENMNGIGIGAQPDTTNKLVVAGQASLFSHDGAGHQIKINKAAENQSASMVFQSNWKGHAEIGLTGGNDFQFKVSEDGSNFLTAIEIEKSSGRVRFPVGAQSVSRIDFSGRWSAHNDARWTAFNFQQGRNNENSSVNAGRDSEPTYGKDHLGPIVRKGSVITGMLSSFRASSSEVSALNIRLVFQYGPRAGAWSNSNVQTDVLAIHNNLAVAKESFAKFEKDLSNYVCPEDGFILMYVQPVGAITETRHVYSSTSIEILSG